MNSYQRMAQNGGVLTNKFNLVEWAAARKNMVKKLREAFSSFQNDPSWAHYWAIGRAVQHLNSIRDMVTHIPLFLGGCDADKRKQAEITMVRDFEKMMMEGRAIVRQFLEQEMSNPSQKKTAQAEMNYWKTFSPARAECLRLEQEVSENKNSNALVLTKLNNMHFYPALRSQYRNNAKNLGVQGYAMNTSDPYFMSVMSVQDCANVRETMWRSMQNDTTPDADVQTMLDARRLWAKDGGFDNYLSYLNRIMPGFNLDHLAPLIQNHLSDMAKVQATVDKEAIRLSANNFSHPSDATLPWNYRHVLGAVEPEPNASLQGNEFSLQQILNVIIPDLLSIGGWALSEKTQKIGTGKECLYLYRLFNGQRHAMMYFAPYPHNEVKESDSYQAYAAILRERWAGPGKTTTPIALVAQNLSLKNNHLTDVTDLAYLAHEIGHILHFFALPGETFDESNRLPHNIGELPSLLLEHMPMDPECLRMWANPKNKAARRLDYWTHRLPENYIDTVGYLEELERCYLDIASHRSGRPLSLTQMRNKLRQNAGLLQLHSDDRSSNEMFDITEYGGLRSIYVMGRAMTLSLLKNNMTHSHIRYQFQILMNSILSHSNDLALHRLWEKQYGQSMKNSTEEGIKLITKLYQKNTKRHVSQLKKKKG